MPDWLTITIAVVGGVGTLFGIFGVSAYMSERFKHRAAVRNAQDDAAIEAARARDAELEAAKQAKYENALREIIRAEVAPLKADVCEIKKDLSNNTIGTVTMLRDRMMEIYNRCKKEGYASGDDKANWMELYKTYKSLGGNHFKEYVDVWKQEMADLPPTKQKRTRKQQAN